MSDALLAGLKRVAGPLAEVAVEPVSDDAGLLDEEAAFVARAIDKRRREFAAGRRAARRALAGLGHPPQALLQGPHRSPVWPDGVTGSISHDAGFAIAAVARQGNIAGIGVDLAPAEPFPDHLRGQILLTAGEDAQTGLEARATFSAKECLYKALYTDVGRPFGFAAAEVIPALSAGSFAVRLTRALGPHGSGTRFQGRIGIVGGLMLSCLTIGPPPHLP